MKEETLSLRFLYRTTVGRICLKVLTLPAISVIAGKVLDSSLSRCLIPPFVKKNHIPMKDYKKTEYVSFNDFFTREIRPEKRPVDTCREHLISPCDGALSVYPIDENLRLSIKNSTYSVASLLRHKGLARRFAGGYCFVFRLRPTDYHRYYYVDEGKVAGKKTIPGILHCVKPIALDKYPVFVENSREYTVLKTKNFGTVVQMEVGALFVGKIKNHPAKQMVRGQEKGYFEFGGSTICMLFEKDAVLLDTDLWKNHKICEEIEVKYGQKIGQRQL